MSDNPLKYKVKLSKDKTYTIDLKQILAVDENKLNDALSKQPELYAWIAVLHASATAKVEKIKSELEKYVAELDAKIRENKDEVYWDNVERLTEKKVEAIIKQDKGREKILTKMRLASQQASWLQAAREAFIHRKDCLISLGANRRAERDIKTSIKE